MENRERQILSEIMDMMASIRSQLEILDEKMVQLQQAVRQEDVDETPIDLDIDDIMDGPVVPVVSAVSQDEPVEVEQVEVSAEPGEVADEQVEVTVNQTEVQEDQQETEDETVEIADELVEVVDESVEVVEEVRQEEAVDDLPDDDLPFGDISLDEDDDLPIFADPEPVQPVVKVEQKVKQAVIDSMTDRQAWRTDMPGTQVKDIRSAISLNDRILFINMLFGQDPMAFQDALTRINQMTSLDEVVDYVVTDRPEWDLESETVYRFMMAVRRKIR